MIVIAIVKILKHKNYITQSAQYSDSNAEKMQDWKSRGKL